MYHDGKTYIWIPSALTLNKVTTATAALIKTVHTALSLPLVTAGQLNPYYFDLNDLDMGGAPFTRDATPGMAVCGPIENLSYLPLDYVSLIVAFGGEVEGLPVWFEISDPTSACPFSDDSESWEIWGTFGESHKPVQLGSKWYRSSAVGQSGALLDASAWTTLRAAGQLVVKTKAEYLAIVAEHSSPIP